VTAELDVLARDSRQDGSRVNVRTARCLPVRPSRAPE
jgi:hypothetical protein